MLVISYREHTANDYTWQQQMNVLVVGRQEILLSTIKRRKISWFGPMSADKIRCFRKSCDRERWKANIRAWTGQSLPLLLLIRDGVQP